MACGDKRKNTCGRKHNSLCTQYDGFISSNSNLHDEECITIEDTTGDLYSITDDIYSEIYLGSLSNSCIDYDEDEYRNVKVNEAIIKHRDILYDLIKKEDKDDTLDISEWNLDTKCLVIDNGCNNGYSIIDLMQSIIDKICSIDTDCDCDCDCGSYGYGYGYNDTSGLGNL